MIDKQTDSSLPKPNDGSIVSYPTRCPLWGDARYRGNCDGRLILDLILRYRPRSVADPMAGSGTSRDLVKWLNGQHAMNISYWGGDLRQNFNLLQQDIPGSFDLVWIHPPYWNIIRYGNHPDDLSSLPDYELFRDALRLCLNRCFMAVNPGGRLAVLVGDVRRQGQYIPIVRDVLNLEGEIGQVRSIIIKAQHNCQSDRVSYAGLEDPPIRHEFCVVFKRIGPTRTAGQAA
ncbi:hypothetical protein RAS1_08830 [Phycisphaerae bacterium RAS1]|nr:hypothetical protein RAS1_08830 [Phycisphaerae bacterium RAS1]